MCGSPENDSADEIEITPEMIEAGRGAFYGREERFDGLDEVVSHIYREMEVVRRHSLIEKRRDVRKG
jgi:hypothetical protein